MTHNTGTRPDVVSPPHYTAGGLEVITILRAKMPPEQLEGYLLGNALKYLFRYPYKTDPVGDLEKAIVYLTWLRDLKAGKAT